MDFDLNEFPSGTYLIRLSDGNGQDVKKIWFYAVLSG